jgi:hypothetical protein
MTIQRLKSPYYVPSPGQQTAYLQTSFGTTSSFVSIGQTGTIAGLTYRTHVFSGNTLGTLYFSNGGYIDLLLLGSGGTGGPGYAITNSGGNYGGGGGGAGGLLLLYNFKVDANIGYNFISATAPAAAGGAITGINGNNSTFGPFTAFGGGKGGGYTDGSVNNIAGNGGSGGGSSYNYVTGQFQPGYGTAGQGNIGGGINALTPIPIGNNSGGGGGFSSAGGPSGVASPNAGGAGGNGININFDGIVRPLAAGGGSGSYNNGAGGLGGYVDGIETGGRGATNANAAWAQAFNGSVPTALGCGGGGGGAGGMSATAYGGYGGASTAGLIIIRYVVNQ